MAIEYEMLAPPRRVINVMFESTELEQKITVEKGFLFYLLKSKSFGAMGPVDLTRGLWYAQIMDNSEAKSIEDVNIDYILEEMAGFALKRRLFKRILEYAYSVSETIF